MKKMMMMGVAALGFATAAYAGPTQLNCPAGSAEKLIAGENLLCTGSDGKIVAGPEIMLYPNGKKMAEGQVDKDGSRTGTWTLFNEQGVKTHTIQFQKGDFHGKWTEFFPNGMAKRVVSYNAGMKVSAQEFDSTGKLVTTTAAK